MHIDYGNKHMFVNATLFKTTMTSNDVIKQQIENVDATGN
jgi:hypothetical protein